MTVCVCVCVCVCVLCIEMTMRVLCLGDCVMCAIIIIFIAHPAIANKGECDYPNPNPNTKSNP